MIQFISGAVMMGFAVAGLFFLNFWRKTKDYFFLIFAVSFWLLALERIPLAFTSPFYETRSLIYLIRLLAFILILVAFFHKNRK